MTKKTIAMALLLLLSACTAVQRGAVETTIVEAQKTADTQASVLSAALCAITVGALNRIPDKGRRDHINAICGGE